MDFDLLTHTHLAVVAGSRAYGIATPESDVDMKGVAVPPARYFHGFRATFEQADDRESISVFHSRLTPEEQAAADAHGLEGSIYEIRKFVRLAAEGNPHILDALFCRPEEVKVCTAIGQRLRDARDAFLSLRMRHSFGSYARSQLKRIQGHRAWLLSPPAGPPSRADFGLPDHTLIPRDQLMAGEAALEKGMSLDDNLVDALQRERAFRSASKQWSAYQRWQRERNADRAALEARHGYDTKHASHLVRLLRMAVEILSTGQVHVWRGDRDGEELRAIRAGAWSYDALMAWAESQEAELERLQRSGDVAVPERVDLDALDALVVDCVECAISG